MLISVLAMPNSFFDLQVSIPRSKSISNRLLLLQKTTALPFTVQHLSDADDTKLLSRLLAMTEGFPADIPIVLDCENCGTAYRFLSAYMACKQGTWILEGSEQMYKRPVKALVDTLRYAGADIVYHGKTGFPPLQIKGKPLSHTNWHIDSEQSSQYVSALVLILPLLQQNGVVVFSSTASLPYIDMTVTLMQQVGLDIVRKNHTIRYTHQNKIAATPVSLSVEYDWSAAAIWFIVAAISVKASIFIQGLEASELQADAIIARWMTFFGVQTHYTNQGVHILKIGQADEQANAFVVDCKNNPDLVPYVASLCVGLKRKGRLKNSANLRFKESNRINAMIRELGKIASLTFDGKDIFIVPTMDTFPEQIFFSSHNDHRMAMALSVLSCCIDRVTIDNMDCVTKSYPAYWDNFLQTKCKVFEGVE
jgi:3-phosphoshikimate 1-carboxyvinyltransferase